MCTHMKLEGNVSNDAALSKAGGRATDKFEGTLVAALGLSCELKDQRSGGKLWIGAGLSGQATLGGGLR
jgi:hypothetical protein